MKIIEIEVEGKRKKVLVSDYIKAKTKQLREFGYQTLTESEVASQLDNILSKEKAGKISIIGMFMKDEVIK